MWLPLIILWAIPVGLVFLVWRRLMEGSRPLTHAERRMLFGGKSRTELTPWVAVKFTILASIFFAAGLTQGVILPNLGAIWSVLVGLLTGTAAVLMTVLIIRSAAGSGRRSTTRQFSAREGAADLFFD